MILDTALELAGGLLHLHEKNIIHGDLVRARGRAGSRSFFLGGGEVAGAAEGGGAPGAWRVMHEAVV